MNTILHTYITIGMEVWVVLFRWAGGYQVLMMGYVRHSPIGSESAHKNITSSLHVGFVGFQSDVYIPLSRPYQFPQRDRNVTETMDPRLPVRCIISV